MGSKEWQGFESWQEERAGDGLFAKLMDLGWARYEGSKLRDRPGRWLIRAGLEKGTRWRIYIPDHSEYGSEDGSYQLGVIQGWPSEPGAEVMPMRVMKADTARQLIIQSMFSPEAVFRKCLTDVSVPSVDVALRNRLKQEYGEIQFGPDDPPPADLKALYPTAIWIRMFTEDFRPGELVVVETNYCASLVCLGRSGSEHKFFEACQAPDLLSLLRATWNGMPVANHIMVSVRDFEEEHWNLRRVGAAPFVDSSVDLSGKSEPPMVSKSVHAEYIMPATQSLEDFDGDLAKPPMVYRNSSTLSPAWDCHIGWGDLTDEYKALVWSMATRTDTSVDDLDAELAIIEQFIDDGMVDRFQHLVDKATEWTSSFVEDSYKDLVRLRFIGDHWHRELLMYLTFAEDDRVPEDLRGKTSTFVLHAKISQ